MSESKQLAVVRLVGPGGTLNTVMAESAASDDIHQALVALVAEAIFEPGDRIEIDLEQVEVD
jgi:hypothetical protein